MKLLSLIAVFLMLCGCATAYKPVKVPVPVSCPSPNIPAEPTLYISKIKPDSPPDVVIKSYVATVEQLLAINGNLRALLQVYK